MSDYSLNRSKEFTNLGGILPFFFIPVDDIDTVSDIINGTVEQITYTDADYETGWIDIVSESGIFTEDKTTKNKFEYKIGGKFAKDELQVRNILDYVDGKKMILLVPDSNGKYRMIGSLDNPVTKFYTGLDKGKKVSDLNAYDIRFEWSSKYRAPFIDTLPEAYYIISEGENLISYI